MPQRLTASVLKGLEPPASGNRIEYDTATKGFGVRVTAAGSKAFVLDYRNRAGRKRRFTIGAFPDWEVGPAREEAKRLKRLIAVGQDPQEESQTERDAKTVKDLIDRFREEHLPNLRPSTVEAYELLLDKHIAPALKHRKVADVNFNDVDELHRKVSKGGKYQANRALAVLSKMFSLAIKWRWRADNPVIGIDRNPEAKRKRYLDRDEIARLTAALATHKDRQAANIVRMLMLTGARRGEVLGARWDQFDLGQGIWTKPAALTKQKTEHQVPLSPPVRKLLSDLLKKAKPDAVFVFPSNRGESGHREDFKKNWAQLCKDAGITGARIHDVRHTFASALASSGMTLPVIGALLGHTQPSTTQRYAHLFDDALRKATGRAADVITGKRSGKRTGKVLPFKSAH